MPTVSVVVCTYNRCESLRDTLDSLKTQVLPPGQSLEILVVDNNSTDRTREVIGAAAQGSRWPIRYAQESQQGVGYARNRGLAEAQGEYIALTDDDTVANADWVAAVVRCFEETGADMVGGKLVPLWLAPRPGWLTDDLLGPLPQMDFGSVRKRCRTRETFLTANCSLRRAGTERYGVFDPSLGRRGERLIGGEDFELGRRWRRAGALIFYEPEAIVHHKVSPERVTPQFYRQWFEDIGYTQAHQLAWKWHFCLSIMPVWRWKKLLEAGAAHLKARILPATDDVRFRAELWWRFQSSFLCERMDHWVARIIGGHQVRCRFARV